MELSVHLPKFSSSLTPKDKYLWVVFFAYTPQRFTLTRVTYRLTCVTRSKRAQVDTTLQNNARAQGIVITCWVSHGYVDFHAMAAKIWEKLRLSFDQKMSLFYLYVITVLRNKCLIGPTFRRTSYPVWIFFGIFAWNFWHQLLSDRCQKYESEKIAKNRWSRSLYLDSLHNSDLKFFWNFGKFP